MAAHKWIRGTAAVLCALALIQGTGQTARAAELAAVQTAPVQESSEQSASGQVTSEQGVSYTATSEQEVSEQETSEQPVLEPDDLVSMSSVQEEPGPGDEEETEDTASVSATDLLMSESESYAAEDSDEEIMTAEAVGGIMLLSAGNDITGTWFSAEGKTMQFPRWNAETGAYDTVNANFWIFQRCSNVTPGEIRDSRSYTLYPGAKITGKVYLNGCNGTVNVATVNLEDKNTGKTTQIYRKKYGYGDGTDEVSFDRPKYVFGEQLDYTIEGESAYTLSCSVEYRYQHDAMEQVGMCLADLEVQQPYVVHFRDVDSDTGEILGEVTRQRNMEYPFEDVIISGSELGDDTAIGAYYPLHKYVGADSMTVTQEGAAGNAEFTVCRYFEGDMSVQTAIENGTITPSQEGFHCGDSFTVEFSPDEGAILSSVLVDGAETFPESDSRSILFENIRDDHTVSVSYAVMPVPVKKVFTADTGEEAEKCSVGDILNYEIEVTNPAACVRRFRIEDCLPSGTVPAEEGGIPDGFSYDKDTGVLSGEKDIAGGTSEKLLFSIEVTRKAAGKKLVNSALISVLHPDGSGTELEISSNEVSTAVAELPQENHEEQDESHEEETEEAAPAAAVIPLTAPAPVSEAVVQAVPAADTVATGDDQEPFSYAAAALTAAFCLILFSALGKRHRRKNGTH